MFQVSYWRQTPPLLITLCLRPKGGRVKQANSLLILCCYFSVPFKENCQLLIREHNRVQQNGNVIKKLSDQLLHKMHVFMLDSKRMKRPSSTRTKLERNTTRRRVLQSNSIHDLLGLISPVQLMLSKRFDLISYRAKKM